MEEEEPPRSEEEELALNKTRTALLKVTYTPLVIQEADPSHVPVLDRLFSNLHIRIYTSPPDNPSFSPCTPQA